MANSPDERSKIQAAFGDHDLGKRLNTLMDNAETLSSAELGYIDGVTAGTVTASKAVVVGADKEVDVLTVATLSLGAGAGTAVTATAAELNKNAGVTAGTVAASKVLVVDANKDLASLRHLTLAGNLVSGATTISETELGYIDGQTPGTVTASKAVVVDANKDIGTFRHVTLSGNLVTGATTLSEAELGVLDAVTPGTAAASKAVVLDANKDVGTLRHLTIAGNFVTGSTTLSEAELGVLDGLTSTKAELQLVDNQCASITFVVGVEGGGGDINVALQFKDAAGADMATRSSCYAYISGDANGDTLSTAHSGGAAIGTDGLAVPLTANQCWLFTSEADGDLDITFTEAGAKNAYLVCVLPNGSLTVSGIITHAA